MGTEDFDIEEMARYLHLTAAQVQRMAERDQIPGRRIGGQWRFSQAEVHHWLEQRIGASDESQLVAMEGVLDRQSASSEVVRIADLIPPACVDPQLAAKSRGKVIEAMVELASRSGFLWDPDRMADAVRAREDLHPTALDNGVALLHPRRPMPSILGEPLIALGRTSSGIPFGGAQGVLTDLFFLICSVNDGEHLRTLARLSRLLALPLFLAELRGAENGAKMLAVVREFEAEL